MALVVALETSTRAPSVAVRLGELERELSLARERAHASDLIPALDALLTEIGAEPGDITGVFAGTGPGSYTGLRVGIATALGLARGSGAPLLGVPSGEALAFAELASGEECCYLLDARQGGFYFARYRRTDSEIEVVEAPCVLTQAELEQRIPPSSALFAEPGAASSAELPPAALARIREDVVPRASAVLELGQRRLARAGGVAPEHIEPLYLRSFAAKARRRS